VGGDAGFNASCARRRSSRITNTPLAITTVAPITSRAVGFADQNTQSIAKAHRMEVYSNGPTTDGGARRNVSVTQYWPSAPLLIEVLDLEINKSGLLLDIVL
jgi:hypothetical protein